MSRSLPTVSRSRTSISKNSMRAVRLLGVVLLLAGILGCKKKPAIAELTKAEGPVERQEGQGIWAAVPLGTKYYLGDAARTGPGRAELKLLAGAAVLKMG